MMTFCEQGDKYEIAEYIDANYVLERKLRKFAFIIVILASFILALMASLLFVLAHPNAKAVNSSNANQNDTTPTPIFTSTPTVIPTKPPKTVLIDAGHGGYDPGTCGTNSGIEESEINLAISKDLEIILKEMGYNVIMTRTDNHAVGAGKNDDMNARAAMIARSDADIFVCIHQNALDIPSVNGAEVYYHESQPDSYYLADCVERAMRNIPNSAPSRGVKTYGHMLTKYLRYSILIECGFLTNPDEEAQLIDPDHQYEIAEAISIGIDEFFDKCFEG